ncbi:hypothetical protein M758_12G166100, partial [Ceratodon purpureus]
CVSLTLYECECFVCVCLSLSLSGGVCACLSSLPLYCYYCYWSMMMVSWCDSLRHTDTKRVFFFSLFLFSMHPKSNKTINHSSPTPIPISPHGKLHYNISIKQFHTNQDIHSSFSYHI